MNDIDLQLESYNYFLPKELIAQEPAKERSESRLLVYLRDKDKILDLKFSNIVELLNNEYILVLNNSKVQKRKIFGKKVSGAEMSIIITSYDNHLMKVIFSPFKRIKLGQKIILPTENQVEVVSQDTNTGEFILKGNFSESDIEKMLEKWGMLPLPPYIKRAKNDSRNKNDLERYQTVYASDGKSLAAPTAGLHFTQEVLSKLMEKGIKIVYVKLDVGIGTFKSVNVKNISQYKMLPEWACVSDETSKEISLALENGKKVLCVGTTTVRTLEFLMTKFGKVVSYEGFVDNFIYPPYNFRVVSGLITNFHLPKSTNLALVSSFVGREKLLQLYNYAVEEKYRFYSYGDAMLIL